MNWKLLSCYKVNDILGGMLHFEYCGELSQRQAMRLQNAKGYHPSHFGFVAFDVRGGRTYWRCSSDC